MTNYTQDHLINLLTTDREKLTPAEKRLDLGEAYMHCSACGARLYSFDGNIDASRPCPYGNRC